MCPFHSVFNENNNNNKRVERITNFSGKLQKSVQLEPVMVSGWGKHQSSCGDLGIRTALRIFCQEKMWRSLRFKDWPACSRHKSVSLQGLKGGPCLRAYPHLPFVICNFSFFKSEVKMNWRIFDKRFEKKTWTMIWMMPIKWSKTVACSFDWSTAS